MHSILSGGQIPRFAFKPTLFYRIDVPYQALIGEDFDPADVKLSIVQAPSKFQPESFNGQSTFNANDEKETLRFISIAASLESGRKACELVLRHSPFERIKTLVERNAEANGFSWTDRELKHLHDLESKQLNCKHRSR